MRYSYLLSGCSYAHSGRDDRYRLSVDGVVKISSTRSDGDGQALFVIAQTIVLENVQIIVCNV